MTSAKSLQNLNDQSGSDWFISKALLTAPRALADFDIRNVITDIEIFEHIEKPFITGTIILVDVERVIERFDIQGAESLELEIQRTSSNQIKPILKKFVIDSIKSVKRANETSAVVHLHFTEDIGYKSALLNVNKAYSGEPSKIIKTIAKDYFNKEVNTTASDNVANNMQVIIPNLTPIEAMAWIKNRSSSSEGYPFYLFSNFATNALFFLDLGTMLKQVPLNESYPYTYSQNAGTVDTAHRHMQIYDYHLQNHETTLQLVQKGFVGAQHSFYDVTLGRYIKKKFSVHNDVYDLTKDISKRQNRPVVSYDLIIDEKQISEYESRAIFNTYASKNFDDNHKSYTEEREETGHVRKVSSLAFKNLLTKNPIEIVVDGREYLIGGSSKTIGNIIKIVFKATDHGHSGQKIDRKLSGDYLIMAARHVFTKEHCRTKLLISKIANYNSDIYTQGADR